MRAELERERWLEPVEDFVRRHGAGAPRWAVILTYELDFHLLAHAVLPTLSRRARAFRTVVIADHASVEGRLAAGLPRMNAPVNVHPARCRGAGVFHPKLLFLRAGHHARACFGSANVTHGGLGGNLELWSHSDSPHLLAGIVHFLRQLATSTTVSMDDAVRRSLRRATLGLRAVRSDDVWSSLDESFEERIRRTTPKRYRKACIISPLYATPTGLASAVRGIPCDSLDLFTDGSTRAGDARVFTYAPQRRVDSDDEEESAWQPETLHAKAYVLSGGSGNAVAWVGSANLTAQAVTRTAERGGNVELMLRTWLPPDELRALRQDLASKFTASDGSAAPSRAAWSPKPAQSTVLSCEIRRAGDSPQLIVHATVRRGTVVLCGTAQTPVRVTIRNGRGLVDGVRFRRLFPDASVDAPQALRLFQLLGGRRIPVLVNVPLVPDLPGDWLSQGPLDALLDDWYGRVRFPALPNPSGEPENTGHGSEDDSEAPGDDGLSVELERRLDEARHQGELDELAVKVAMLRRRIVATKADARAELWAEASAVCRCACPDHLHVAVSELLGVEFAEPGRSR